MVTGRQTGWQGKGRSLGGRKGWDRMGGVVEQAGYRFDSS